MSLRIILFLLCLLEGCVTMQGPHKNLTCSNCHDGKGVKGMPALKAPENPSLSCRECHNFSRRADHHPASIEAGPFGRMAGIAEGFHLHEGKMECLTCHKMHQTEDYTAASPFYLAGGQYKDRREICLRCHTKASFSRINPHIGREEKDIGRKRALCLVCHAEEYNQGTFRSENLLGADAFLCWRCHTVMQADYLMKHFLLDSMTASGVDYGIGKVQVSMEGDMHLDPFSRMTCTTCHDPHDPFDPEKQKLEKGRVKPRSPKLCLNCHGPGV